MENMHNTGQAGGSLSLAVDRLDRALEALESRVRALRDGEPLPDYTPPANVDLQAVEGLQSEYQRVVRELEIMRNREQALTTAAQDAFHALGAAAADIRHILENEVA
jgi:hypothetical protein